MTAITALVGVLTGAVVTLVVACAFCYWNGYREGYESGKRAGVIIGTAQSLGWVKTISNLGKTEAR